MAWRNPRYAHAHAARDIGVAGITWTGAEATGFEEEHLIDDRMTALFKWSAAQSSHYIQLDLGAGFATGFDRLYIPNHTIAGAWTLQQSTASNMSGADTLATGTATSGTDIDVYPLNGSPTASSKRYIRFTVTPSGQWQLGQFWFTTTLTTTTGPEQGWTDEWIPNTTTFGNGDSVQHGAQRRFIEHTYPYLGLTAADLTAMDSLVAATSDGFRPFLFDPAYDTESVLVVKMESPARVETNTAVPNGGTATRAISIRMSEYLG